MIHLAMIPGMAGLNRLWGSDVKNGRTLSCITTALMCLFAGLIGAPWAALLPLGWLLHRTFGFDVFGGSLDPENAREDVGSWLRFFLFPALVWLPAALLMGVPLLLALGVSMGVATLCTLVSVAYHWTAYHIKWDTNIVAEALHGAIFGAGMACLMGYH